ncbi:MAG: hypothetical protein A2020_02900 [Lentisphaerae bacterium GWF2_45_14]|nr:MAG: hypothetical protein A2020_02900 [Lentisphaerae bacterium GWF2_45_14]
MSTEFKFLESRYIKPVMEAGGIRFHLKRKYIPEEQNKCSYSGPFSVKNTSGDEDIQVTVNAGDIIAGTTKVSVPETDIAISSSCVVYIELSYSDSSYSAEIKTASSMPGLSSTVYRTRLADITFQDSRIKSVTQMWQYGDIYVTGRFI